MNQIKTFDKYAIFARGLKQYQAVEGKTLAIDSLEGEIGSTIEFKDVLFRKTGDTAFEVGKPFLTKPVKAVIVKHMKGPKKISLRFKRRKKVSVQKNSRAHLTVVRFETV
jgi:large subunit ribosomal protein L21